MSKKAIEVIERELTTFEPADQERLSTDFASYLRRLQELRRELMIGQQAMENGDTCTLADLDTAINAIRQKYAGA